MQTQQMELLSQLGRHGWRRAEDSPYDHRTLEWWADEVWALDSVWPPQDCRIYLTFVVDPLWEGPRPKGQGVWAVAASAGGLGQMSRVQLPLGRGWRDGLTEFFNGLTKLRSECREEDNQAR